MDKYQLKYKNLSKTIIRRYIPAVISIVILLIAKQFIVQYQINQDSHLSKVVNLSGRQRMLSQRISKDAYALYLNEDENKMNFYLNELKTSVDTWKKTNIDLREGNASDDLHRENSNEIIELFSKIEGNHEAMLSASYDIIDMIESRNYSKSLILDKVNIIESNEGIFLEGMDKIVLQYDKESRDRIMFLGKTEMGLFLLTLTIILFEILHILLPAGFSLSTAFEEIQESNETMLKLFKTAHEALFVVDQESMNVLLMNKQAEKLMNINSINNKSISIENIVKCKNIDYHNLIERIKTGEKNENVELIIDVNENRRIDVLLSSKKINFYKKAAILIGLFDITVQKKAEEVLKNLAITDELTGLYNRRYLEKRINEEIEYSDCHNESISIIILDLDHFKNVNDTWGHPIGDAVLKQTAEIAKNTIRKSDVMFRLGGEEFLVLMPRTTIGEALIVAERIRETIEKNPHPTVGKFTASLGVAEKLKFESFNRLYKRTDGALYKAKEKGRNCVVCSDNQESASIVLVSFKWKSEWESGNKEIDKQHREILDISNSLIHMLLSGEDSQKTVRQLDMLFRHIVKHFNYEEDVMRSVGYEDYDMHSKIHRNLLVKVLQVREYYQNGELKSSKFFSLIIDDIVLGHMLDSDMKVFQYIRYKDNTN